MKTGHTPSPWTASSKNDAWITGPDGKDLLNYGQRTSPQVRANSNLICASPDLLAMLKAANHALYVVGSPKAMRAALAGSRDLIRKAEGRDA